MTNDVIEMVKASTAGTIGVGTWYINLSQVLQLSISLTCLAYLVCKIFFLVRNKGK